MVFSLDNLNIGKLLEDVKNLFSKQRSFAQPPPAQTGVSETPILSNDFKAPIHGEWHNLGGYSSTMKRYDGRTGHQGVDMAASAGTSVYALTAGVVNKVGTDGLGGNIVGVQHSGGLWSYYAHLATAKVQEGDKVDSNTVIGTVGNTGNAGDAKDPLKTKEGGRTWPHCHFGVKQNGAWVDPAKFFNIPAYDPVFAKNPGKYQKFWLSDTAKQEAEAFNMREHTSKRRIAFSRDVGKLAKLADHFYKLSHK